MDRHGFIASLQQAKSLHTLLPKLKAEALCT